MNNKIKKIVNWSLLVVSALMVVSGYGIVKFKLVGPLFGGLVDKSEFFKVHSFLTPIFILLLLAHVVRIRMRK